MLPYVSKSDMQVQLLREAEKGETMALITYDLFGAKTDKVKTSVGILKAYEPEEGYYLAFSGGKDSVTVKALCDIAGVKYDAHYNATTVDPKELVRFIIHQHPDVEIIKPEKSMQKLIVEHMVPPTRLMRYCCEDLKEVHGIGRVVLTGVRWAESGNRKKNQGLVTFTGKKAKKEVSGITENFTKTHRGGGGIERR